MTRIPQPFRRSLPILAFVFALSGALLAPHAAQAQTIGSALTNYGSLDGSQAQVYIYIGGSFTSGTTLNSFTFLDPSGAGYLTPILFEQATNGVYTVRGIGTSYTIATSPTAQTVAFNVQAGTAAITNNKFTIGFMNAAVGTNGVRTNMSAGTVTFSNSVTTGTGVSGGATTNAWNFTPSITGISIPLGTTFYDPTVGGATGTYNLYTSNRTYAAQATAAVSAPEPGSMPLIVFPILSVIGAGIARRRKAN